MSMNHFLQNALKQITYLVLFITSEYTLMKVMVLFRLKCAIKKVWHTLAICHQKIYPAFNGLLKKKVTH